MPLSEPTLELDRTSEIHGSGRRGMNRRRLAGIPRNRLVSSNSQGALCTTRFLPGEIAVFRDVQRGKLLLEFPHIVVRDSDSLVALYIAPGTWGRQPPPMRPGLVDLLTNLSWTIEPAQWHSRHVLRCATPGSAHSVNLFWTEETWSFEGWYVNLQDPLRRVAGGFETRDHALDLWVGANREWRWKDEDDLEALTKSGHFDEAARAEIRAEGFRVVEQIEGWAPPFSSGWEDWRPDALWEERLRARAPSADTGA
jgi:hypothetical protein